MDEILKSCSPIFVRKCAQSCLSFCDPVDCSLPGSSVHGFPRQEYWSGLPFLSAGDLPDPGLEPTSLALVGRFYTTVPCGKPPYYLILAKMPLTFQKGLNSRHVITSQLKLPHYALLNAHHALSKLLILFLDKKKASSPPP